MRLAEARLCLDCDEIHTDAHCPVCASESFAFIKRWVNTGEKRPRSAPAAVKNEEAAETLATYRALLGANDEPRSAVTRFLRGGAVGLALLGAAGWLVQRNLRQGGSQKRASSDSAPASTTSASS
jgi:hypothetical protein